MLFSHASPVWAARTTEESASSSNSYLRPLATASSSLISQQLSMELTHPSAIAVQHVDAPVLRSHAVRPHGAREAGGSRRLRDRIAAMLNAMLRRSMSSIALLSQVPRVMPHGEAAVSSSYLFPFRIPHSPFHTLLDELAAQGRVLVIAAVGRRMLIGLRHTATVVVANSWVWDGVWLSWLQSRGPPRASPHQSSLDDRQSSIVNVIRTRYVAWGVVCAQRPPGVFVSFGRDERKRR